MAARSLALNLIGRRGTKSTKEDVVMSHRSAAAVAVIVALSSAPASAAVCLGKSMMLNEIVDTINAAPGCERAMKIFQNCKFGASGDVDLGAAVEKNCEVDFLPRLEAPRKRSYQQKMRVCDRKYRNQSGTMDLSFTAFCPAEVAQRYSRRALKTAGAPR
jgi:hypothetical protein